MSYETEDIRTARKEHQCFGCCSLIETGERYSDRVGLYDDEWFGFKLCRECCFILAYVARICDFYSEFREGEVCRERVLDYEGIVVPPVDESYNLQPPPTTEEE